MHSCILARLGERKRRKSIFRSSSYITKESQNPPHSVHISLCLSHSLSWSWGCQSAYRKKSNPTPASRHILFFRQTSLSSALPLVLKGARILASGSKDQIRWSFSHIKLLVLQHHLAWLCLSSHIPLFWNHRKRTNATNLSWKTRSPGCRTASRQHCLWTAIVSILGAHWVISLGNSNLHYLAQAGNVFQ